MAADKTTIIVERIGKFGVMSGGVWFNLSSKSGLKISDFSLNTSYDVLVYTSDSGKKYINQIVGTGTVAPVADKVVSTRNETSVAFKPGDDKILEVIKKEKEEPKKEYKSRDFDAEARGKIACALRAALYASPAVAMYCTSWDEYVKKVDAEVLRGSEEVLKAQRG